MPIILALYLSTLVALGILTYNCICINRNNEQVQIFQMLKERNLDSDLTWTYFMRITRAVEQMEIELCLPLISPVCSLVCLFWLWCVSVFMYFVKDCSVAAFNDEITGSVLLIN